MEFHEYLNTTKISDQALAYAARMYVSELSGDLLPDVMRKKMTAATQESELASVVDEVTSNAALRHQAVLTVLADAWNDPAENARVRRVLDGAQEKMPVIEAAIIGIMTMYAMYLIATDGRKKTTTVTREADGSYKKVVTEFHDPAGPLSAITGLFSKK